MRDTCRVYLIQDSGGRVKIGSSENPESRLATLQTAHADELKLLASCHGGREYEKYWHSKFESRRLHGEWFQLEAHEIDALSSELNGRSHYPNIDWMEMAHYTEWCYQEAVLNIYGQKHLNNLAPLLNAIADTDVDSEVVTGLMFFCSDVLQFIAVANMLLVVSDSNRKMSFDAVEKMKERWLRKMKEAHNG